MPYKKLIKYLGFVPKENTSGIYQKKYAGCKDYKIEVDAETEEINYGTLINAESSTTLNFTQNENWVVLECVNRLLEKGYQPQNIVLEKTWATGHGTSGRLDILVTRNDGSSYLMIECKTWGAEFDKEQKRTEKDGGQLFTYFQQDKNADVLMLYASVFDRSEISFKNVIVKIEDDYRQTGNVKDFYERWNKLPKTNGIFENGVAPYEYQSKALTKKDLRVLRQEDSSFIFNRFLEILRHNVVSDKPNAFNKIFTLFLCKIVDENRNEDEQLHFQWIEGEDTHISFQKRLTDLYNRGMLELLEKTVTDVSDSEFDKRFKQVDDKYREEFKNILTEIRLKKNNEFAIKEVYDDESFYDNAKVVKEIVELLQVYQLRYNYRQQFLSDFFELLLTTGLKQESGQFFTPVPVARFILRSIPTIEIIERKLLEGNKNDLLPTIIDYAAGSGHFVTESMEDIQKYIDNINDVSKYSPDTKKIIKSWKESQFDWAEKYVYAIEKDYRLVKTAKVSCYLHGDGLAKVIHGDGLGDFGSSKDFKDLLKISDRTYTQDNKQFDIVVSNPPYSVSAFKGNMMDEEKAKDAFDLYSRLTDQSCEIECLFIERTKQLLKDGGIAGIILPSSILSNSGIYTQSREIIFKYFEIIAITELGNNTFMATGTNTVILFLRRRNNADWVNIRASVDKFAVNLQDVTINGFEKPVSKYVSHVWENIGFDDYLTLIQKQPNATIKKHEIFKEYDNKVKARNQQEKLYNIVAIELEKLFYFVLAYPQKIVLVKSGEKDAEKQFLGYEFSNRRGSEGIHPIQRSKTIDECTMLYDAKIFDNPEKACTYIYKTFKGEHDFEIHDDLKNNISQLNLVDLLSFDRVEFEKNISLSVKKKVEIKSKFEQVRLGNITTLIARGKSPKYGKSDVQIIKSGQARGYYEFDFSEKHFVSEEFILDERKLQRKDLLLNSSGVGTAGRVTYFDLEGDFVVDGHISILRFNQNVIIPKYALIVFGAIGFKTLEGLALGQSGQIEMSNETIVNFKIPLPPKVIQETIVSEIEILETLEKNTVAQVSSLQLEINSIIKNTTGPQIKLEEVTIKIGSGATPLGGKGVYENTGISFVRSQNIYDSGFVENGLVFINQEQAEKLNNVAVEKNDILFNITGASIARCCLVPEKYLPARVNQHVSIIRLNEKALPKYVQLILVSDEYKNKLLEIGDGATSREAITKSQLENFKIPLPNLDTQKQIVQQREMLETQIADLQKQIDLIPKQKEQILKKYLE
ncbi:MAG: N-6 DNA methylase [Prolixibacteraceae bacterium]|jgi:type I restriction enzyme M protein|nr:N-6 DNA methylase [Prolixibacteraceae bacterium]